VKKSELFGIQDLVRALRYFSDIATSLGLSFKSSNENQDNVLFLGDLFHYSRTILLDLHKVLFEQFLWDFDFFMEKHGERLARNNTILLHIIPKNFQRFLYSRPHHKGKKCEKNGINSKIENKKYVKGATRLIWGQGIQI
jgi:hypothetical protein